MCRELGTKKNVIVLNDEAHHCDRRRPDGEDEPLTGEDRVEAKRRSEEARRRRSWREVTAWRDAKLA